MASLHLLVLDAYAPEGRAALREAGGTEAGRLYERMLSRLAPGSHVEVAYPADPSPALPSESEIARFDGIAWTGSSLTIHAEDDPRVLVQIELARTAYRTRVPSFGSCWAAQIASVAAGGRCAVNPRGREFGIARKITLSSAGLVHPLFAGKPPVFDAFTSHADEVVTLASNTSLLASNEWSQVQAVDVRTAGDAGSESGRFWALQYHPEYDLHEVASLCRLRKDELIGQGTFASAAEATAYIEGLEALHAAPADRELADSLGIGPDLLDPVLRTREAANWLASLGTPG